MINIVSELYVISSVGKVSIEKLVINESLAYKPAIGIKLELFVKVKTIIKFPSWNFG